MRLTKGETSMVVNASWDGAYLGGRVRCPDGKVRVLKRVSPFADTFFSISAAVDAYGKTVTGFVSVDTEAGEEGEYAFTPYSYGVNAEIFNDRMSDERKESAFRR